MDAYQVHVHGPELASESEQHAPDFHYMCSRFPLSPSKMKVPMVQNVHAATHSSQKPAAYMVFIHNLPDH